MAKRRPRKKKEPSLQFHLLKILFGLGVLICLVVLAGLLAQRFVTRPRPVLTPEKSIGLPKPAPPAPSKAEPPAKQPPVRKSEPPAKKPPAPPPPAVKEKPAAVKTPTYEIYPPEEKPPALPPVKPKAPPKGLPRVSIIIDDMGYDEKLAERMLAFEPVLTFSMFPYGPSSRKIAKKARAKGFEIMLHLPMEPNEYPRVNPGPGTLFVDMTPDELIAQLKEDLDYIPGIKGVNNHMGSKMTAVDSQMNQIFTILKKRGLFFIDSRTTTATISRQSARLLQVPFAERDVFLDHVVTREFIEKQFKLLIKIALEQGQAIGIGHPHSLTLQVIQEFLPEMKAKVHFVPASDVVHIIG